MEGGGQGRPDVVSLSCLAVFSFLVVCCFGFSRQGFSVILEPVLELTL